MGEGNGGGENLAGSLLGVVSLNLGGISLSPWQLRTSFFRLGGDAKRSRILFLGWVGVGCGGWG